MLKSYLHRLLSQLSSTCSTSSIRFARIQMLNWWCQILNHRCWITVRAVGYKMLWRCKTIMTLLTLKKLCQHPLTCLRIFNKLLLHQLGYTTSKTKLRQITSTDLNLQGHLISFSTQVLQKTQVLLAPKSKIKWLIYLFRQTAYNNLTNGSRLITKPIKIFRYFENLVLIKVPLRLA